MVKVQIHHFVAPRQANYATIANYLAMELRYMDAGDEAQSASRANRGLPG